MIKSPARALTSYARLRTRVMSYRFDESLLSVERNENRIRISRDRILRIIPPPPLPPTTTKQSSLRLCLPVFPLENHACRRAMNSRHPFVAPSRNTRTGRIFGRLIKTSYDLFARNISPLTAIAACRRRLARTRLRCILILLSRDRHRLPDGAFSSYTHLN